MYHQCTTNKSQGHHKLNNGRKSETHLFQRRFWLCPLSGVLKLCIQMQRLLNPNPTEIKNETSHPNGLCQAHPPNFRSVDTTISPMRLILMPLPFSPSRNFALHKFSFSLHRIELVLGLPQTPNNLLWNIRKL